MNLLISGTGHAKGISSILVPGAGEPNFDSTEADPFENRKRRAEKEVRGLLDKIQPDMITLDPDFVGSLAPPSKLTHASKTDCDAKRKAPIEGDVPFRKLPRLERLRVQGKADETETARDDEDNVDDTGELGRGKKSVRVEKEKMKMRGKGKALKRYLKKKRKNVIEPSTIAIRAKLEKQQTERKKEREREKRKAMGAPDEGKKKSSALDRFKRKN